jgi:hypothetical protein
MKSWIQHSLNIWDWGYKGWAIDREINPTIVDASVSGF